MHFNHKEPCKTLFNMQEQLRSRQSSEHITDQMHLKTASLITNLQAKALNTS